MHIACFVKQVFGRRYFATWKTLHKDDQLVYALGLPKLKIYVSSISLIGSIKRDIFKL